MKNWCIRSIPGSTDYLSVLNEVVDGYMVRIYRDLDGYEQVLDEFISKDLFDSCVRTGYLTEMQEPISAIA